MIRSLTALLVLAACTPPRAIPVKIESLVSRKQLDQVETPLMAAALTGPGTLATMQPAGKNGPVVTWRSADAVTMSLKDGLIVATRGLGDDLMAADIDDTRAVLSGHKEGNDYTRIHTYLDGEYQTTFRAFRCRIEVTTPDTIRIVGATHKTTRIEESCFSPEGNIANTYWVGSDGTMWRSKQWISRSLGYMETELLVR